MCLRLQPFDPQGINSSWGIGCKHNEIRHSAWGVCCKAPLRCDIHAYCCWDIYRIKVDDVVLYIFSQLKRQKRKRESFEEAKIHVWSLHLTNKAHSYPWSLNRVSASVYLKWLKSSICLLILSVFKFSCGELTGTVLLNECNALTGARQQCILELQRCRQYDNIVLCFH